MNKVILNKFINRTTTGLLSMKNSPFMHSCIFEMGSINRCLLILEEISEESEKISPNEAKIEAKLMMIRMICYININKN